MVSHRFVFAGSGTGGGRDGNDTSSLDDSPGIRGGLYIDDQLTWTIHHRSITKKHWTVSGSTSDHDGKIQRAATDPTTIEVALSILARSATRCNTYDTKLQLSVSLALEIRNKLAQAAVFGSRYRVDGNKWKFADFGSSTIKQEDRARFRLLLETHVVDSLRTHKSFVCALIRTAADGNLRGDRYTHVVVVSGLLFRWGVVRKATKAPQSKGCLADWPEWYLEPEDMALWGLSPLSTAGPCSSSGSCCCGRRSRVRRCPWVRDAPANLTSTRHAYHMNSRNLKMSIVSYVFLARLARPRPRDRLFRHATAVEVVFNENAGNNVNKIRRKIREIKRNVT